METLAVKGRLPVSLPYALFFGMYNSGITLMSKCTFAHKKQENNPCSENLTNNEK